MSESEIEQAKVKLSANGDLTISEDGNKTVIAHYDRKTGTLEFTSRRDSEKYYNQVVARLGSVSGGTEPSQNVIRAMRVKGDKAPNANAPKRPKLGPLGDSAADIVEWYLTYDLPQAIIRYGLYLDENGKPVQKRVRRKVVTLVDVRGEGDEDVVTNKQGKTETKGPVGYEGEYEDNPNAYIARRATALTFTPNEVVGGYQPDDDFEPAATQAEEEQS